MVHSSTLFIKNKFPIMDPQPKYVYFYVQSERKNKVITQIF